MEKEKLDHFDETKKLILKIDKNKISEWLLTCGYFPETNILPPSFSVNEFKLQDKVYVDLNKKMSRKELISISYPKTSLTMRKFSIQHPKYYHDIVFYLNREWDRVIEILFNEKLKIYSYSIPIPVTKNKHSVFSSLRSGRMIYEWISMAENDLIRYASCYKFIARTDIANFYQSIYTHSIAWAMEGRDESFNDKKYELVGNKIDRLMQYSNGARSNGIPVGSALSDLIAEIILAKVDRRVSEKLQFKFIALRFKDDYRFLCNTEEEAKKFLRELGNELSLINLTLNESKTSINNLPHGLYRNHDREYFIYSIKYKKMISFKEFEYTLLHSLDIHRRYPGTSIIEKFLFELLDKNKKLKISFSSKKTKRMYQIEKFFSLLLLTKRESEKIL